VVNPFFFSRSWTSSECVLEVDEIRLVLEGKADVETTIIEVEDIPQVIVNTGRPAMSRTGGAFSPASGTPISNGALTEWCPIFGESRQVPLIRSRASPPVRVQYRLAP